MEEKVNASSSKSKIKVPPYSNAGDTKGKSGDDYHKQKADMQTGEGYYVP